MAAGGEVFGQDSGVDEEVGRDDSEAESHEGSENEEDCSEGEE